MPTEDDHPARGKHERCTVDHGVPDCPEHCLCGGGWPCPYGGPDAGHRFKITFTSSMSSSVIGEDHADADWWAERRTLTVRAWDLPTALSVAAQAALDEWQPDDGSQRPREITSTIESVDLLVKFDDQGRPKRVMIYDTLGGPETPWGEWQSSFREGVRELQRRVRARRKDAR